MAKSLPLVNCRFQSEFRYLFLLGQCIRYGPAENIHGEPDIGAVNAHRRLYAQHLQRIVGTTFDTEMHGDRDRNREGNINIILISLCRILWKSYNRQHNGQPER